MRQHKNGNIYVAENIFVSNFPSLFSIIVPHTSA